MSVASILHLAIWAGAALTLALGLWWQARKDSRLGGKQYAALAMGIAAVAIDLGGYSWLRSLGLPHGIRVAVRMLPALACLGLFAALNNWRLADIGFRSPDQGWKYWSRIGGILGGVGVLLCAIAILIIAVGGWSVGGWSVGFGQVEWSRVLVNGVILAPVLEEAIYRFALCTPAAPTIGKWPTVIVSGLVFAALHFAYGNPDVTNFGAGYLLGWMYLHSRSLLVPILFHALGNLMVLGANLAFWYFL